MALLSGDKYLASLRELGRHVYIQGEKIRNVPDHPIAGPPAMAIAQTYYQAEQVKMKSLFTAQSNLTGDTVNRFTHIQQNIEDLVNKILMLREMGRKTACCFQRCAGLDCMNTVYAITYDMDQTYGTEYHPRFRDFMEYVQTNDLIDRLSKALRDHLAEDGFKSALTPATHNFDEAVLMARWSHKHLGYLAGLGRFGVHHVLITPAGCAGRLGSLVTEAELGDHPLIETEEACLLKAGQKCGQCIDVCPVEALSEAEFDRQGCWERLNDNRDSLSYFSDLPKTTHVCGKCAAIVPCSFKNPVAQL